MASSELTDSDAMYDARVTVIGRRCFAVAIHAINDVARVDWRADVDALSYEVVDVPGPVRTGIGDYCARLGLNFAAFDFSVDKSGAWWFLEANPNGLWAWLEDRVCVPVADAIASFLVGEA
jgi:hypothetical protein